MYCDWIDAPALLLYAGSILWVIGYDTIYAHQDKEDDAIVGVGSTARLFGDRAQPAVMLFYVAAMVCWIIAGSLAGAGWIFIGALVAPAAILVWQVATLDRKTAQLTATIHDFFVRQNGAQLRAPPNWTLIDVGEAALK